MPTNKDDSLFCCYCGNQFNSFRTCTAEHLIPLSRGGANNWYNKRNCCSHCNTQKGSLLPHEYLENLLKQYNFTNPSKTSTRYNLEIKIENVKYIIQYVDTAGEKIFKNTLGYLWFERRYLKKVKTA